MKLHEASLDDVMLFSVQLDAGHAVGAHFTVVEFACKDGSDNVWIHPWLVEGLDALREWSEGPVTLTNAFRTVRHNEKVGGAKRSKHLYGFAADVFVHTKRPKEVSEWADDQGFGGIGLYRTFVHLDVYGTNRRWKG